VLRQAGGPYPVPGGAHVATQRGHDQMPVLGSSTISITAHVKGPASMIFGGISTVGQVYLR
jgi:hypothetical protein